jgi:putative transposase
LDHPVAERTAVKRAYKLRAYPTRPQEGRAVRLLADHCDLYNAALQERREAWRVRKVKVSYGDQSAQLKEIRAADPDGQGRHSFTAQQQTLRRLNAVFTVYFKRVRNAETSQGQTGQKGQRLKKRKVGYPRFKPRQRFDQVLFVAGDGARWEPADGGRWAHATFQAVGRAKVNQHRPVVGRVKTLQLKREGRRWYVVVVTETETLPLPSTGRSVGVDLGVARFLTTSDGEVVPNPRFLDAAQRRITDLQRRTERARPGSGNRRRLRRALAKQWRRVGNQRRDFHHKTARGLVDTYDAVALEDLHVAAMTATASGTGEDPGRNVAAKARLNRSILDAGWTQFTRILVAKAESAGRRVLLVHPASTSIDCHTCGARCSRPRQDTVVCPVHGELDADLNGARNIATRAGLGSGQASTA